MSKNNGNDNNELLSSANHHEWAKITNPDSPGVNSFNNYHWDFEKHCTQENPKLLSKADLGYTSPEEQKNGNLGMTHPFKILTDEAVAICRDIIKNDENLPKYCKFNELEHDVMSHRHQENTYAYRNVAGINIFFREMLSCKKFEAYIQKITGEPIEFWELTWQSSHCNIQLAAEKFEEQPNIDWHTDVAQYAMLINISDMPENPEGGETLLKKKNGEIIPMKYMTPGDTTIVSGVHIEHCGMPGKNYNKMVIAAGLGVSDTKRYMNQFAGVYAFWNGDSLHYVRQYTGMCVKRLEKQVAELAADGDKESREELAGNVMKELANFKTSLGAFYDHVKNHKDDLNTEDNKFLS